MNDADLAKLSLQELKQLQEEIHAAIWAAIRAKNASMASGVQAAPQATAATAKSTDPKAPNKGGKLTLEQERDAWLASRKGH